MMLVINILLTSLDFEEIDSKGVDQLWGKSNKVWKNCNFPYLKFYHVKFIG